MLSLLSICNVVAWALTSFKFFGDRNESENVFAVDEDAAGILIKQGRT